MRKNGGRYFLSTAGCVEEVWTWDLALKGISARGLVFRARASKPSFKQGLGSGLSLKSLGNTWESS